MLCVCQTNWRSHICSLSITSGSQMELQENQEVRMRRLQGNVKDIIFSSLFHILMIFEI